MKKWDQYLQANYGTPTIELVSGRGSLVQDRQGKKYIDFLAGIATTETGTVGGDVKFEGPLDDLIMQGDLKARDAMIGVDYLGTKYRFDEADFIVKSNGIFTRYPIQMYGKLKKGKAKATFAFTHNLLLCLKAGRKLTR